MKLTSFRQLSLVLIVCSSLFCQKQWLGTNSASWSDAGNWNPAGQPLSSDQVIINNTANSPVVDGNYQVASLTINSGASLTLNGFRLNITGNVIVSNNGGSNKHLIMTNSSDSLIIAGDLTIGGQNSLDTGYIFLAGNFRQQYNGNAVQPAGTKFIFNGTVKQTIRFDSPSATNSYFKDIEINKNDTILINSNIYITGHLNLINSPVLIQSTSYSSYYTNRLPSINNGAYEIANTYVLGNYQMQEDLDFKESSNNLTIFGGSYSLSLNGYSLRIGGAFTVGNNGGSNKHLRMTNPDDSLIVKGNATFGGQNTLDTGNILIAGDFRQQYNGNGVQAGGTRFTFNGTSQSIRFDSPGAGNSYFADLLIRSNLSFVTNVYIKGQLILGIGSTLNQSSSYISYYTNQLPSISNGSYLVANTYVLGNYQMQEDLDLKESNNDFVIQPGSYSLSLNSYSLRIGGTFTVANNGGSNKHLLMTNPDDSLIVKGNLAFGGQNTLDTGNILIAGDFRQQYNGNAVQPSGTRFTFNGANQSVRFDSPAELNSYFGDILIRSTTSFVTNVYIKGQLILGTGSTLNQANTLTSYYTNRLPTINNGSYMVAKTNVLGNYQMQEDLDLKESTNDFTIFGGSYSLSLNSYSLRVGGTFTIGNNGGSNKHLRMTKPGDSLIVKGNTTFGGQNTLDSGNILIAGDFRQQYNGNAVQPSGTRFTFNGTSQSIRFDSPGAGNSYFADVLIRSNSSFVTNVYIRGQLILGTGSILNQSNTLTSYYTNRLPSIKNGSYQVAKTNVLGNYQMQEDLDLKESVNDLTISAGYFSLALNSYSLRVGGTFDIANNGGSNKHLVMVNADDSLIVKGNATFGAQNTLDSGNILIAGDFRQQYNGNAVQPSGTRFTFNGTSQSIRFDSPGAGNSYFTDVLIRSNSSFVTNIYIKGHLILGTGSTLNQANTLISYYTNRLPSINNGSYMVAKTNVLGNYQMQEDLDLKESTNDFTIFGGSYSLSLNSYSLRVGGAFTVGNNGGSNKHLLMTNPDDSLIVKGNATFGGQNTLDTGNILIAGDFRQQYNGNAVQPTATHFTFNGTSQSIRFDSPSESNSYFRSLRINPNTKLELKTNVYNRAKFENFGKLLINSPYQLFLRGSQSNNQNPAILRGTGTINTTSTNFLNTASIEPGDSVGTFNINGNVNQNNATISIDISSSSVYDRLNVTGALTLSGALKLNTLNNFIPSLGDSLRIIDFTSSSGLFDTIIGNILNTQLAYEVKYKAGGIDLIVVKSPNIKPYAGDDFITINEDHLGFNITVLANDSDANFDPLMISSIDTMLTTGSATIQDSNTKIRYIPKRDFNGKDSVRYILTDGRAAYDTARVIITVNPINDFPFLSKRIENQTIAEDSGKVFIAHLDSHFTDIDADELSYSTEILGLNPPFSVSVSNDSLIILTEKDSNGTNQLVITASDGSMYSMITDTVSIVVSPVNDPPIVKNRIADKHIVEDSQNNFIADLSSVFRDIDGDSLSYTSSILTRPGLITVFSRSDSLFVNTVNDSNGLTDLMVTANDGNSGIVHDTLQIRISKTNDLPVVFNSVNDITIKEDTGLVFIEDLKNVFKDPDKDQLSFEAKILTGNSVGINPLRNDSLFIRTLNDSNGSVQIEIAARDLLLKMPVFVKDTFLVTVTAVNDAPEINSVPPATAIENQEFTYRIRARDVDNTTLSYIPVNLPSWLSLSNTGNLSGTPSNGDVGTNSVHLRVSDGLLSVDQSFTITVTNVNDRPGAFSLLSPANLTEFNLAETVRFRWNQSKDIDSGQLNYAIRIYNNLLDTTISGINDTTYSMSLSSGFRRGEDYKWFVRASDNSLARNSDTLIFRIQTAKLSTRLAILQNPVLTDHLRITINSDSEMNTKPLLVLRRDNLSDTLELKKVDGLNNTFYSNYNLSSNGIYHLSSSSIASNGAKHDTTRQFNVNFLRQKNKETLDIFNSELKITVPAYSFSGNRYIISEKKSAAYHINNPIWSKQEMKLEFSHEKKQFIDPSKVFVLQEINGKWKSLNTQYFPKTKSFVAYTKYLTNYKLEYNPDFTGSNLVPENYQLKQNYPNPFNPSTTIAYDLADDGFISIRIYNSLGQKIKTLVRAFQRAGRKEVRWNGLNNMGQKVSSGIYFYILESSGYKQAKKMILLK